MQPAGSSIPDPSGSFGDDAVGRALASCLALEGEARDAAIERACREHPERAAEIRERVGALAGIGMLRASAGERFPERLGEFRLVRRLGGGGMGIVYVAEQEPLGRLVALKLIRPEHLYFPGARERFRRETEAIARLNHPGIVPIYTVGEADGVPYFAMELAAGRTLAEVLESVAGRAPERLRGSDLARAVSMESEAALAAPFRGSWVEASLELARQVAGALEHAHALGIVHRDVKPSNVIVTADGRARLIDFGLASSQDEQRLTRSGAQLGSVLYMSPEQVRGEAHRVGRQSDVYSLGVTLYELLALQPPYCESDSHATRAAILAGRPPSIRSRNRAVSPDAETVCLAALDLDPARRYASARDFADDLANVLALRPIRMRPASAWLVARRWMQRNRAASAAIALGFALLVGIPSALFVQQKRHSGELKLALDAAVDANLLAEERRRLAEDSKSAADAARDDARTEAQTADQVSSFLVDLFAAPDPENARGREVSAREVLERGLARIGELEDQARVQARMLERMGQSFTNLGLYGEAEPLLDRALELMRTSYGEQSLETAYALVRKAKLCRMSDRCDPEALLGRALEIQVQLLGGESEHVIRTRVELAAFFASSGRDQEAEELLTQSYSSAQRLEGDQRQLRAMILSNWAHLLSSTREYGRAAERAREALALLREIFSEPHPLALAALNTLAVSLKNLGELEEADRTYGELLVQARAVHGPQSPSMAIFQSNHAALLEDRGELARAEALYRETLDLYRTRIGADNSHAQACMVNLAGLLLRSGRFGEARALYAEALPGVRGESESRYTRVVFVLQNLGLCQAALGDFAEAEVALREALELTAAREGERTPRVANLSADLALVLCRRPDGAARAGELSASAFALVRGRREHLGVALKARYALAQLASSAGRAADAEQQLTEALAEGVPARDAWVRAALQSAFGEALAARGAFEEAHASALAGADDLERALGTEHSETRHAWSRLVALCDAWGHPERAEPYRARLATASPSTTPVAGEQR